MGKYTLGGLILETVVVTVLYHLLFFRLFKSYITKYFEKQEWWQHVSGETEPDQVKKVQEEIKYLSILSLHHNIGGLLMTIGFFANSPSIFVHGLLLEVADDIHDSITLLFSLWPFNGADTSSMVMYMLPHHLFGMIIAFPLVLNGWVENPHSMAIGAALLMAGGVTLTIHTIQRSQNRSDPTDAWDQFLLGLLNGSVFMYCRFYVFPVRMYYLLIQDGVWFSMSPVNKLMMIVATSGMTFFNVLVGMNTVEKVVKSFQNAREVGGPFTEAMERLQSRGVAALERSRDWMESKTEEMANMSLEDYNQAIQNYALSTMETFNDADFSSLTETIAEINEDMQKDASLISGSLKTKTDTLHANIAKTNSDIVAFLSDIDLDKINGKVEKFTSDIADGMEDMRKQLTPHLKTS